MFGTYKKSKITKMLKAVCYTCAKELHTVNIDLTSENGLETSKEIRVCMKCLSANTEVK